MLCYSNFNKIAAFLCAGKYMPSANFFLSPVYFNFFFYKIIVEILQWTS